MHYLYVKTHNVTGLKYLGQTQNFDPYNYSGSGKYWKRHLKIHGDNFSTTILLATESLFELKETGIFFSKLWNVVKSKNWANLIDESGTGISSNDARILAIKNMKNGTHPFFNINKKRVQDKTHHLLNSILVVDTSGTKFYINVEEFKNRSDLVTHLSHEGRRRQNLPIIKQSQQTKIMCPHCHKEGGRGNMIRYHFNNCKLFPS